VTSWRDDKEFTTNKDVLVFLRSAPSMLLAALLMIQSVVPCCAISKLLSCGDGSEAAATQVTRSCSCCPRSQSPQPEPIPSDEGRLPEGECPYCGGLLLHFLGDNAASIHLSHPTLAMPCNTGEYASEQPAVLHQALLRQLLGHQFLNTGISLLI